MVLAPVLAIVLALLVAGAINSFAFPAGNDTYLQSTPEPSIGATLATPAPQAAASVADVVSPFFFIAGAVIVGLLVVLLFFREKGLNKALSE